MGNVTKYHYFSFLFQVFNHPKPTSLWGLIKLYYTTDEKTKEFPSGDQQSGCDQCDQDASAPHLQSHLEHLSRRVFVYASAVFIALFCTSGEQRLFVPGLVWMHWADWAGDKQGCGRKLESRLKEPIMV